MRIYSFITPSEAKPHQKVRDTGTSLTAKQEAPSKPCAKSALHNDSEKRPSTAHINRGRPKAHSGYPFPIIRWRGPHTSPSFPKNSRRSSSVTCAVLEDRQPSHQATIRCRHSVWKKTLPRRYKSPGVGNLSYPRRKPVDIKGLVYPFCCCTRWASLRRFDRISAPPAPRTHRPRPTPAARPGKRSPLRASPGSIAHFGFQLNASFCLSIEFFAGHFGSERAGVGDGP